MAYASEIPRISSVAWLTSAHRGAPVAPHLDHLMLFGFTAAFAAAVCYLRRHESRAAMLAFAASLAATGVYGFAEGAWPLGVLETIWAVIAATRGLQRKFPRSNRARRSHVVVDLETRQARYREIFGSN